MKKTTILSISIAALLVGGVLLTSLFTGQVYASSTDSGTAALLSEGGTTGRGEELATALGITVDELTTAWKKAFTAAVDDALKAGYITVSQAETLRLAIPDSDLCTAIWMKLPERSSRGILIWLKLWGSAWKTCKMPMKQQSRRKLTR